MWDRGGLGYYNIYSNFAGQVTYSGDASGARVSGTNIVWSGAGGQIYSNFGDVLGSGSKPAVSGSNAVWEGANAGIYTNFAGQLSTLGGNQNRYSDISGTNVAWWGTDPSGQYAAFQSNYGWTLPTIKGYDSPMGIAISGTNVVWWALDSSFSDTEIYTNFAGQLTDNQWEDRDPDISGTNVAWLRRDGSNNEIWTNFGGRVFSSPDQVGAPAISGTNVVWSAWDGQGYNIFMATYGEAQVVPLPGAVLLGVLGLGAAGLKLHKYA